MKRFAVLNCIFPVLNCILLGLEHRNCPSKWCTAILYSTGSENNSLNARSKKYKLSGSKWIVVLYLNQSFQLLMESYSVSGSAMLGIKP